MSVDLVESELSDHPLKDMDRLLFEMVLVIMNPSEQSGHKCVQVWCDKRSRKSDCQELDQTEGGFDDLSVLRAKEDGSRSNQLVESFVRDVIYG